MAMARLTSPNSQWKEENLLREHPMDRKTWMELPCHSQTSSQLPMAMSKTMRGSLRMARGHLNSRWKRQSRVERQVGTIMVPRMIKMKTMKHKRLTELIISNKHEIKYKASLIRDRNKDTGYKSSFLTMLFNFHFY